ncbi:hypothetical protein AXF42_Ash016625 [Apostasia shenzhenica]|uniref:PB1 domain-containing protein n=1 Tax=Apostasia shenzhenica TaxID=1088818 RepID=A0A2I0A1M3_9ASPA|nr:hypothetical protein AXF42_Ash016625 [Apostasia shenzhenica]
MCHLVVERIRVAEEELGSAAAESGNMDSPAAPSPGSSDERGPRAKFLCSFGGGILPRPLDGRLRYVGGETRIVAVPRDVSYEDLLSRMREIFDGTSVIKYQQPDEDLDALVSVVNDDDVMNMMEEYDKLGSTGDGFTRLRIFLFSQLPDTEAAAAAAAAAAHFDADERETERRYVDALNSLTDVKSPSPPLDFADHYLSQNALHHLNIPHPSHGNQLYGDVDSQWSPAYFSPVHHGAHDPKEFPVSPSSSRYHHLGISEFSDQNSLQIERQSPSVMENMVWLPPGAIIQEKSGFPSNIGYKHNNVYEGNPICENCHISYQRGQTAISNSVYLDPRWKHGQPHIDQSNACAECYNNRDHYVLNQDIKLDHGVFLKEPQGHERSWLIHPHHNSPHLDDSRVHYIVDANAVNAPYGRGNFYEGNEVFQGQQAIGASSHMHIGGLEDNGVRYGNHPSVYGADSFYQLQHNLPPLHLRRKVQAPLGPGTSYESPSLVVPNGAMGGSSPVQGLQDGSPKLSGLGMDIQTQSPWVARNGNLIQRPAPLEYFYEHTHREKQNVFPVGGHPEFAYQTITTSSVMNGNQVAAVYIPKEGTDQNNVNTEEVENLAEPARERTGSGKVGDSDSKINDKNGDTQVEILDFLPELIASVKKAALAGAEEVKAMAVKEMDADSGVFTDHNNRESLSYEVEVWVRAQKCL